MLITDPDLDPANSFGSPQDLDSNPQHLWWGGREPNEYVTPVLRINFGADPDLGGLSPSMYNKSSPEKFEGKITEEFLNWNRFSIDY